MAGSIRPFIAGLYATANEKCLNCKWRYFNFATGKHQCSVKKGEDIDPDSDGCDCWEFRGDE